MAEIDGRVKILVTGANGFVGTRLTQYISEKGCKVVAAVRDDSHKNSLYEYRVVGGLEEKVNWKEVLVDIDVVVHLSALAHNPTNSTDMNQDELYDKCNYESSKDLFEDSIAMGVKKIVYISTIGVHGNVTEDREINEDSELRPYSPYTKSKLKAENILKKLLEYEKTKFTIFRPPVIYGKGAPGNFGKLEWLVKKRLPLPFALVRSRRSMISIGKLCDEIYNSFGNDQYDNEVFVISDKRPYAMPDILKCIAASKRMKVFLFPFPVFILRLFVRLALGKQAEVGLFEDLYVDSSKLQKVSGCDFSTVLSDQLNK